MKLKEIINGTIKIEESISFIFKELYTENLAADLDIEDLETILKHEITTDMVEEVKTLITNKPEEWDYFDIMKILNLY